MNDERIRRWQELRANGRTHFILLYGGLYCGILGMGVLGQFFVILLNLVQNGFSFSFWNEGFTWSLATRFALALPVGLIAGWALWFINERNYRNSTQK